MSDKVKIQPTEGKYLSATVDGKNYDIFLVDPSTGERGTVVPKRVAMILLASRHPVVNTVIEDGVQPFTAEEIAEIKALRANPDKKLPKEDLSETNKTLEALVLAQSAQLEAMKAEIADLKKSKAKVKKEE